MAHLLRGKQAGIQNDLSAGLTAELFVLDDINRFGINSQVSALAYDPVQSLLAIGTNETKFGEGQVYVFGHRRVSAVFHLPRKSSVKSLHFCADKLLCFDARNDLLVFSLETKRLLSSYSPPGSVFSICCDPAIDYVLLGMQSGDVLAYDMDRGSMAPLKIPSFWKEQDPRVRVTPVMALALHPRDVGSLLIGYAEGAVVYSFKQNAPVKYFRYEVPRGAPGGDADPVSSNVIRHPRLTHALWHPTGTFILTGHEDGSLVFWDAKDGRLVMARTLTDTNIDKPISGMNPSLSRDQRNIAMKQPLFKIVWCANQDPEDTMILISGGTSSNSPSQGLTLFEMGRTPVYATSSWQILTQYLESPKRQRMLPTPPDTEVVDFCLIPRTSPHFSGGHDPIVIIPLLASGEIVTMSFPSGFPVSPTNQLHVSLTFVHPFLTSINLSPIDRGKWLGLVEKRSNGPLILTGGAPASRPMKRFEDRNIVQTAHADGTVRLWDAGHGDEIENEGVLQVDVSKAVGRPGGVDITRMSLAGASGELAVGTRTGEVAIFRWGHNKNAGREASKSVPNVQRGLTSIAERAEPELSDGLLPFVLADMQNGPVTALKLSDVGFVAAGFEGGNLIVIDLRGPAIIFEGAMQDLPGSDRRGGGRKHSAATQSRAEWATAIEFSVMSLDGDSYSSILLHVGTNLGHLATFKILPENGGRYGVQPAGLTSFNDRVLRISPIHAESGHPAYASQETVAGLRNGSRINGILVVVTNSEARIFKPANSKGASKSWDFTCQCAGISRFEDRGYALVVLGSDGYAHAFSLPALREIGSTRISNVLDAQRLRDAVITMSGDVLGWTGPAETALLNVWGSGLVLNRSKDVLYNPELLVPPRPTISNMQWISGVQYITPAELDFLIGGPDRPPSKRMLQESRANEAQARSQGQPGASSAQGQQEGYWAYMQRQVQERTEKLGTLGESVNKLEDASSSWANEASKFASKTKKNMIMGAVKGRFGL